MKVGHMKGIGIYTEELRCGEMVELLALLSAAPSLTIAKSVEDLVELAVPDTFVRQINILGHGKQALCHNGLQENI